MNQANIAKNELENAKSHFSIQSKLAQNLMGKCNMFKQKDFFKMSYMENKIMYNLILLRKNVLRIDDLNFYELELKTEKQASYERPTVTIGYLVEDSGSKRCFGLL